FAVLAEELGLVGVVLTLALFVVLAWRAFHISQLAAEAGLAFQAYCAAGFGIWLGLQTFINIGVNMGILPTKGLTLPLMSYGGSSMLVTLGWLGLVMRIYHEASTAGRLAGMRRERPACSGRCSACLAAPAGTSSRRSLRLASCASTVSSRCGLEPRVGWRRSSCRRSRSRSSGSR